MDGATLGTLVAALGAAVMGGFAALRSLRPQRISEYDVLLAKYTGLVADLEKAVVRLKEENDKCLASIKAFAKENIDLKGQIEQLREVVRSLGGKI